MSKLDRVLGPGSTELPDCICGHEMTLASEQSSPSNPDTGLRIYSCPCRGHELRLTVWADSSLTESVTAEP